MIQTTDHRQFVPLGSVARFIRGITFKPDELINGDQKGAVACLRTKNVQADLDESDIIYVPEHLVKRDEQYVQPNDMLVSTANSWELVGKTSLVRNLNYRATAGGFISILRADNTKIFPRYLYYWFTSPEIQMHVRYCGRKTTNISNLNYDLCLAIEIPLPYANDPARSLPEQKRIAAILDKSDSIRRKQQEATRLTDTLLSTAFCDRFGDPVSNSRNWPTIPLKKYGAVTTGNTPSRMAPENYGTAIEWIKSDNINSPFHYLTRAIEGLSEIGNKLARTVEAGATLVTCIAGSRDCVGNVAMTNRTVAFNQQINAITPSATTDPCFLYTLILLSKLLVQQSSTESMKGMVSKGKFEQIQVIDVPPEEQKIFGRVFKRIIATLDKQYTATTEADDLFNSLVQRAFRGEL